MKTLFNYLHFVFLFLIVSFYANSQVGINTKSPTGVFNILKVGGSSSNESHNLVIDKTGVGIGTSSPSAMLDIRTNGAAIPALKISDGSQSDDYALITNAGDGYGSWGVIKGSGGTNVILSATKNYVHSTNYILALNPDGSTGYTVRSEGGYLFLVRWNVVPNTVYAGERVSCYLRLRSNRVVKDLDHVEYYASTISGVGFSFTTVMSAPSCKVGDELSLILKVGVGDGTWTIINDAPPTVTIFRL